MTKYRDLFLEKYGQEDKIASIVGCGLDRLGRDAEKWEIDRAERFYRDNKESIDKNGEIGGRSIIEEFVKRGCKDIVYTSI